MHQSGERKEQEDGHSQYQMQAENERYAVKHF